MKSKKTIIALTFTVFIIFIGSTVTSAAPSETRKILFSEPAITDSKVLYEKALKNESQLNFSTSSLVIEEENVLYNSATAILEGEGESVELETYSTTQLVEVVETENGTEEVYIENIFVEPTEEDFMTANSETRNAGGSKTDNNFYAVRSQATVSYTMTTRSDGRTAAKLNYVKTNWTLLDNSVRISNRRYYFANVGVTVK